MRLFVKIAIFDENILALTNQLEEVQNQLARAESAENELKEKLQEEITKREEAEFTMEEKILENSENCENRKPKDEMDDLEDFGDDEMDKNYFLGEIEDLKQQMADLQEEKIFAEDELKETLSAEKEKNVTLSEEIQNLKSAIQNSKKSVNYVIFCKKQR